MSNTSTDDNAWMVEWSNDLANRMPESWDGDEAQEAIIEDFVDHAIAEVKRLGGCLRRWCRWEDRERCDHGYLPQAVGFYMEGDRRVSRMSDLESGDINP